MYTCKSPNLLINRAQLFIIIYDQKKFILEIQRRDLDNIFFLTWSYEKQCMTMSGNVNKNLC